MKFEAVTIKDIAKALGFSTSTVSRALRDSYEISAETKKIVLEYAKQINYHPNPIALSLKERRSRSIGVLVCEIANTFFSQAINGMESIAYNKGYNVVISQSHESYSRELIDLQYLASRSIDGLLISVSSETKDFTHLRELHERGLPIVFFDRIVDEITTHKVVVDNQKGARDAVNHLIEKGYKRIAHISNSASLSITTSRVEGYHEALLNHKIESDEKLLQHCEHGGLVYSEIEEVMKKLLSLKHKPDAIFASSDKITTACLRYFKQHKIKVPTDIALVGFSNSDLTELLDPPLTIVKQPAFEMGEIAMSLLLNLIESKHPVKDFETKTLETQLLVREST